MLLFCKNSKKVDEPILEKGKPLIIKGLPDKKIEIKNIVTHKFSDRLLQSEYLTISHTGKPEYCNSLAIGIYILYLRDDGNLVFRYAPHDENHLWESNTSNYDITKCILQNDGNLVMYDSKNNAQWASHTSGGKILLLEPARISLKDINQNIIWDPRKHLYDR